MHTRKCIDSDRAGMHAVHSPERARSRNSSSRALFLAVLIGWSSLSSSPVLPPSIPGTTAPCTSRPEADEGGVPELADCIFIGGIVYTKDFRCCIQLLALEK